MLPEASRMNSRLLLAGVSVFATSSPLSTAMAAPGAPARSNSVHNNVSNLFMARLPRLLARHRMRLEAERVGDLFQRGHVLFRIATGDQRPIARGRPTDLVLQTERAAHPGHPALVHRVASRRVLPFAGDQLAVLVLVRPAIGNLDEPVRMPLLHLTSEPGFLDGRHDPCDPRRRSEEHTSELQSLMRTSYAVFCLKKK